jgi:uncharacterized DUF497 family protein
MRFHFDPRKSKRLRENPRRGIGFEEAQKIFDRPYYLDQRSDVPEQYLAIGWVDERLCSLVFEIRGTRKASFTTWLHFGNQPAKKRNSMPKTLDSPKTLTADEIAELADSGKDILSFFTGKGKMMPPIQRVNVDFALPMLKELDQAAMELNISRQAVIKTLLRHALDQQYLARRAR